MPQPPNDAYIRSCSPGQAWSDGCAYAREQISERLDNPEVWESLGLDSEETKILRLLVTQALQAPYAVGGQFLPPSTEALDASEEKQLLEALQAERGSKALKLSDYGRWLQGRSVWSMPQEELQAARKRALDRLRSRVNQKS